MVFLKKKEVKRRPGGAQMETKMKEIRGKFGTSSQEPPRGGFGEDFRWIWKGFQGDFGGIWEARGAQLETKIDEFRGHFPTPSQEASKGGLGEGPGWIGEGFWEGFVRIWEDLKTILNGIWDGFRLNFRRISD